MVEAKNESMKQIPLSNKVRDEDLDGIEMCNCKRNHKGIYFCYDPKPDCEPG